MQREIPKMKIGVLVDSACVDYFSYQICHLIKESELFDEPVVFICESLEEVPIHARMRRHGLRVRQFVSETLIKAIQRLEAARVNRRFPGYGASWLLQDLHLQTIPLRKLWTSKADLGWCLSDDDVERIQQEECAILLMLGTGRPGGRILDCTCFGVISTILADRDLIRGEPSGFWEVCRQMKYSGFAIEKLSEEPDGSHVVAKGKILTASRWLMNDAVLRAKSNPVLLAVLAQVAKKQRLPLQPDEAVWMYPYPYFRLGHSLRPLLTYLSVTYWPRLLELISSGFRLGSSDCRWSIAVSKNSQRIPALCEFTEVDHDGDRFLADPFVVQYHGRTVIFAEDMNCFGKDHGVISALEIKADQSHEFLGVVLREGFHLSFPFVFDFRGRLYMVPESHESRQIRLYQCIEFPMKWEFCCVLMEGVAAADSLVIEREGIFYLLTNICSAGIGDLQSELHVFWSQQLESSSWEPLAQGNPVLCDAARARNGGLIFKDGVLYRVNQHHERGYGTGFRVNRITHLSPDRYEELPLFGVDPTFKKGIDGTHHFSSDGEFHAIDYRRPIVQRSLLTRS